jgi:hypothetical protein
MWPITTLAARSRGDIAATAASAGVASDVGDGSGSAETVTDGDADGCAAGPEAQDVHTAANATTIASRAKRGAEVTGQA